MQQLAALDNNPIEIMIRLHESTFATITGTPYEVDRPFTSDAASVHIGRITDQT